MRNYKLTLKFRAKIKKKIFTRVINVKILHSHAVDIDKSFITHARFHDLKTTLDNSFKFTLNESKK